MQLFHQKCTLQTLVNPQYLKIVILFITFLFDNEHGYGMVITWKRNNAFPSNVKTNEKDYKMKTKSKNTKSVKATTASNATVAPTKTKTVKATAPKLGKYNAPAIRPNRGHTATSAMGDRKWIFKGVTEIDKNDNILATDVKSSRALSKAQAERVLAKALQSDDIENGRLFFKKAAEDGTAQRGVYVAYVADNGKVQRVAPTEETAKA